MGKQHMHGCGPHPGWAGCGPRSVLADAGPAPVPVDARPPIAVDLRERDRRVVEEIAGHDEAQIGFQGIKRSLDLHPEALRRSLKRLQEDGFVEKRDYGYALTEAGHRLLAGRAVADDAVRPIPVAALLLPSHLGPDVVVERFARRWFEGLHWYGVSEGSGETTLTWLTERGGHPVRLRIGMGGLRVEVTLREAGTDEGLSAAAPLVASVAQLLRERPAPPVPAIGAQGPAPAVQPT